MSKTETLSLDLLRLDGDTQARIELNPDTVDEYAELIKESGKEWPFEPLTVCFDGTDYWVADGFHRTMAAQNAGRASVPCRVLKGTSRDARIIGMTANDKHGLRMSREDRRKNVVWLLETYPEMTQALIAENAGVTTRTVERIVSERKQPNPTLSGKPNAKKKAAKKSSKTSDAAKKKAEKVAREKARAEAAELKAREKEAAKKVKDAERAAAKEEKAKQREKEKAEKKAARDKARAEAKEAKFKSLPIGEQVKLTRDLADQLLYKTVNALDAYNRLKKSPSFTASDKEHIQKLMVSLIGKSRHIAFVKLIQEVGNRLW